MKYILTEKQLRLIMEDNPLSWVKRRIRKDILQEYIQEAEINFPTLCDDFPTAEDYANGVIKWAIDDFLTTHEDIFLDDRYDEVSESLIKRCENWFGENLISIYNNTCLEED